MKLLIRAALGMLIAIILLLSCGSPEEKKEQLAKTHCSSCHAFPDPTLLDKKTWENSVLPKMAFRMGLDYSQLESVSEGDQPFVMQVLPANATISVEEWEAIKNYYITLAPDSLPRPQVTQEKPLGQFEVSTFQFSDNPHPTVCLLEADTVNKTIYVGTRLSKLYKLDFNFKQTDQFQLASAPSDVIFSNEGLNILTMGIMDPNDQPKGSLNLLDEEKRTINKIIDSLKRPASMEQVDLNNDGLKDYVICAFGNYTGALLAFENIGANRFKRHTMSYLPGARNVIIRDYNNDGLPDVFALLTQGDEQIIQFTNKGNFDFKQNSLLRFSPVYGSSYFDIADFNNDGQSDILYTNGDNADYSEILKPYHGVRIFLNDGHDSFKESWFYAMDGASKALAHDFDKDGDLDIAAFSFFPDFAKTPERSFIYFENTGSGFTAHVTPMATSGRWLVMEIVDLDNDKDSDILLGSLNFTSINNPAIIEQWSKSPCSVLILRNKLH
jgi:hypothetical protein